MALVLSWCLVLLAVEGSWCRSTHGQSPHEQGLRSSPELPVPDLIESPLKKYDPGLQDLNATELHLILGKGFHPGFMSVSQPPAPPRGRKRNYWWKRRRRKGRPTERPQSIRGYLDESHPNKSSLPSDNRSRLPPWISDHLTPETPTSAARRRRGGRKRGGDVNAASGGRPGGGGGRGGRRRKDDGGSGRWRRRLRRLLLSITHCPVRWTWKDVGIRFWPRWIKEGRCGGKIPPGEEGGGDQEDQGPPAGFLGKGGALRKGKNRRRNGGRGVIPLPREKNAVPRGSRPEPGRRRAKPGTGEPRRKRPKGRQRRRRKEKQGSAGEEANTVGDSPGRGSPARSRRGRRAWPGEEGSGDQGQEPTCSIPAGMVCRPSRKRRITLLRWHCREWKDLGEALSVEGSGGKASWAVGGEENNNHLKCQWIKVEYPIVTECSCQCPK
ncbi:5E5 antigen-like [Ischnura elegans]|uniref:5E5 antigen-like n=1 Tax=Ischnura elegans TaxID=197161 RepID=UPI001ED871E9|nr:5E5 antigen-like [Ischnura elegans]